MEFLNNIYWRNGQPLTSAERNLIIYSLVAGLDNKDIAIALSRGKRTIDKWVQLLSRQQSYTSREYS